MKLIDWIMNGDTSITQLISTNLLDEDITKTNDGYIKKYLDLFDENKLMWGNGLYSPKWISTTYTLLDLVDLEALPDKRMTKAYNKLRNEIVKRYTLNPNDEKTLDLCIVGFLVKLGAYLEADESVLKEFIDFILYTINADGAWNCFYNYREYKTSSLHTTINVLEGLLCYKNKGFKYRINEISNCMSSANEFILKKQLFRSRRAKNIIHKNFLDIHYPTRWRYDMFRAMEYFVDADIEFDPRMKEALDIITSMSKKGVFPKGKTYTGRVQFKNGLR